MTLARERAIATVASYAGMVANTRFLRGDDAFWWIFISPKQVHKS
jgi:hypothetical protein